MPVSQVDTGINEVSHGAFVQQVFMTCLLCASTVLEAGGQG